MSNMGSKVLEVQEDIAEMLVAGKSPIQVKEIIEELHGSMYTHMVEEMVNDSWEYGGGE